MDIFPKLVLLILNQLPLVSARAPLYYQCDNNDNLTEIYCNSRLLDSIPKFSSVNVTLLDLSYTETRSVGQYMFSAIPNLLTLKMKGNCDPKSWSVRGKPSCQVKIHYDALKSLHCLKKLDLAGNSLTTLPWLPTSIIVLDLEHNCLFNITQSFGTPCLEKLFLAFNCYYENPCSQSFYIHEDVYKDLKNLKNLTLGFNNLTSIPPGLPASLTWLDLKENTITDIPEKAFAAFPYLEDLNLEWNCQRCDHAAQPCFPCPNNDSLKLHQNSFYAKNSSISYLSLRGNSLRNITKGLFLPLTKLQTLDLSDNYLAYTIRNGSFFSELKHLKSISLIYNYKPRQTFDDLVLSPHLADMSHLEILLLSGNFFKSVSEQSLVILSKLKQLKKLEMRMNFIINYNMSSLGMLPSLTSLDLSQNMLSYLPCNASSGSSLEQGVQDPSRYNYLSDVPTLSTHIDQTATESDMCTSDNIVFEMWHFKRIFCQNNLTINLSQNNVIFLHEEVFHGMENVVCLNLSYNYASQTIKGGLFSQLKSLVYLDMSYNRVDLYFEEAFSELNRTLKVLDLSQNEYHFRMKGMGHHLGFIHNLTYLEVLNLEDNSIGMRIDPRLRSDSLKYMYFSGNSLDLMWEKEGQTYLHFFQDLRKLIYLDISRNQLHSVEKPILCNLPVSLQAVSISNNLLNYFSWPSLTCLGNLSHLNLSGNLISSLPDVTEFPPDFSLLDLSNNLISNLPLKFFSGAKALQCLYLNNNQLKELNHQLLPPLLKNGTSLQLLTLHHNQFSCSCHNSGLQEFLKNSNTRIPHLTTDVRCVHPESLLKKSVLTVDQHSCQAMYGGVAFFFSSLFVCALTTLPLLRHLYGWDIWYCLQILWARCKGYRHPSPSCSPKHYDAFVVFDTDNQAVRDWVYNELVVRLESSGYRRFTLCLEERDWIPGLSCIENLHHAVYSSEKTVFVLSNGNSSFTADGVLVSGVTRQAFFMVQQRLLDEKVDVAVLVLLDKVFPKLKYLQLRKWLCRRSVMSWPRNPQAQPLFWSQMRAALASDNLQLYDHNISKSLT